MSRTIAIGDIHGCDVALRALLKTIRPQRHDTLVTLGDLVDRGPNSAGVIETLLELMPTCRLVPLIGNHEIMMFQGMENRREFEFWMQHGGQATIASYGNDPRNIPPSHLSFLGHCLRHFEIESHFFVHANYEWQLPLVDQPDSILFWQHIYDEIPPPHYSRKIGVIGHTPQVDGTIRNLGHAVMLDTYCCGNQWLTAWDVNSPTAWQANNAGEVRIVEIPAVELV